MTDEMFMEIVRVFRAVWGRGYSNLKERKQTNCQLKLVTNQHQWLHAIPSHPSLSNPSLSKIAVWKNVSANKEKPGFKPGLFR